MKWTALPIASQHCNVNDNPQSCIGCPAGARFEMQKDDTADISLKIG